MLLLACVTMRYLARYYVPITLLSFLGIEGYFCRPKASLGKLEIVGIAAVALTLAWQCWSFLMWAGNLQPGEMYWFND